MKLNTYTKHAGWHNAKKQSHTHYELKKRVGPHGQTRTVQMKKTEKISKSGKMSKKIQLVKLKNNARNNQQKESTNRLNPF